MMLKLCILFGTILLASSTSKPTRTPTTSPNAIKLCPFHVNIDATLAHSAKPYSVPANHPIVQPSLSPFMPRGKNELFII